MSFLSIVTRHHPARPELFESCLASVNSQNDPDFEHIILNDDRGLGIAHANKMFYTNKHKVTGDYVFILDDDDVITTSNFVTEMKEIAKTQNYPDIIFIRMLINGHPRPTTDICWGQKELVRKHIGSSCFIMKNKLWQDHIHNFLPIPTTGDFEFIFKAFRHSKSHYWHDRVYSKTLRISQGRTEEDTVNQDRLKNIQSVDDAVTGLTVVYNSIDLIKKSYESVRSHHPYMKLIIIDGSDKTDPCYSYIASINDPNTEVFQVGYNIGHGRGLCYGIKYITTPYVLIFDSDIEMLKSPVQSMLNMMEDNTYGVGYTEQTDIGGWDFGARPDQVKYGSIRYLHPYFCLLQLKEYSKYPPFIHHGAPAIDTMLAINRAGLVDSVIKEFPGLGHSSGTGLSWKSAPREFIRHDIAGTRTLRRDKGKSEIEGLWTAPGHGTITCITPTGDRPEAFALCRTWMERQSTPYTQWIVVDDGFTPLPERLREGIDYIRREPSKSEGHTLNLNIRTALPHIKGDKILIIEDDDWYGPSYIDTMSKYLNVYDMVGEGFARYYHIQSSRFGRVTNRSHASFCQTGFTKQLIPTLEKAIPGDPYIDHRFWNLVKENKHIFLDPTDQLHLHCSTKGLKGRAGIGTGHIPNAICYTHEDINLSQLIHWVGPDNAKLYMDHIGRPFTIPVQYNVLKIPIHKRVSRRNSWQDRILNAQAKLRLKQSNIQAA